MVCCALCVCVGGGACSEQLVGRCACQVWTGPWGDGTGEGKLLLLGLPCMPCLALLGLPCMPCLTWPALHTLPCVQGLGQEEGEGREGGCSQ